MLTSQSRETPKLPETWAAHSVPSIAQCITARVDPEAAHVRVCTRSWVSLLLGAQPCRSYDQSWFMMLPDFLTITALGLSQMCFQLHNHLSHDIWWQPCAQADHLSPSKMTKSLTFCWASPGLRSLTQSKMVSPDIYKCKVKEFGKRR